MKENKKIDDLVGSLLWIIPSVLFFVLAYFVGFRIGLHWRLLWLLMWVVLVLIIYAMFHSWKKRNKDTNFLKFQLLLYLPIWLVLAFWTFRMVTRGGPCNNRGIWWTILFGRICSILDFDNLFCKEKIFNSLIALVVKLIFHLRRMLLENQLDLHYGGKRFIISNFIKKSFLSIIIKEVM